MEKQRHIVFVNDYKRREDTIFSILSKKKKKDFSYTKQDAVHNLLNNVFSSKK
jgi:hypothetical protein